MKLGALIQARMSSARLPGKVLRSIKDKPLLEYTIERLGRVSGLDLLVVCTSKEKSDNPIADFCDTKGLECFRGSLHNVALRFRDALLYYGFDCFLRICADSPFIDQTIVDSVIHQFHAKEVEILTNVYPRSFPKGQSVELIKSKLFIEQYKHFDPREDYEHVSPFFYRHSTQFRIYNLVAEEDFSDCTLQIDTPEDLEMAEKIALQFTKPHWEYSWQELLLLKESMIHTKALQQLTDV